jgi:NAD(P)-dependent dehydrogenase (short-subunit alcohol dehydrogenase family)
MGKLVVRMPSDNPTSLPCAPIHPVPSFSPDCSYLLAGGLGGLGQAISSWMVKHGARHLVYLSRSAGEPEDHQAFIRQLELQGCHVTCIKGTVTSLADVQQAVSQCSKSLAGIIQLVMNNQVSEPLVCVKRLENKLTSIL